MDQQQNPKPQQLSMKPFKLDYNYEEELAQFAGQMENITPDMQKWLEGVYDGGESSEFYRGLTAGFAGAVGLLQQLPAGRLYDHFQSILTFLASKQRKIPQTPKIATL